MWLTCTRCGRRFAIHGKLADDAKAFYAAQPNHTPDKEVGVCDACWATIHPDDPPIETTSN
jgi:hypothetical protein